MIIPGINVPLISTGRMLSPDIPVGGINVDLSKLAQAIKAGDVPPPDWFRPGERLTPEVQKRWRAGDPVSVIQTGFTDGIGTLPDFQLSPTPHFDPAHPLYTPAVSTAIGPTHADVVPGRLMAVDGVPISGPGVPEPPPGMVAKQWSVAVHSNTYGTFRIFFFKLLDKRVMCYNPSTKTWKIWRPKKNIVISSDPRMSTIRKLERTYNRVIVKLARKSKALKLAK